MKVKLLIRVRLLATPWTAAYQAPPSMGFSRQEYWSGVPLPSGALQITDKRQNNKKKTEDLMLSNSKESENLVAYSIFTKEQ